MTMIEDKNFPFMSVTERAKKRPTEWGSTRLSFYLEKWEKIPRTEVLKMTVIGFEPPIFWLQVQTL